MGAPWLLLRDPSTWIPKQVKEERVIALIVGFAFLLAVTRQVLRPTTQERADAQAQRDGHGFFARAMSAGKAKAEAEKKAARPPAAAKQPAKVVGPAKKNKGARGKKKKGT